MKPVNEIQLLVTFICIGYTLNFICGCIGASLPQNSFWQLFCYQLGDTASIMGSVLAARYVGTRGLHLASSAFILLGITHGISLAASGVESLNIEKGIGVVMPMIPAFILMYYLTIVPRWLRYFAFLAPLFFAVNYGYVMNGHSYYNWPAYAGYFAWMMTELAWAYFIYRDYKNGVG